MSDKSSGNKKNINSPAPTINEAGAPNSKVTQTALKLFFHKQFATELLSSGPQMYLETFQELRALATDGTSLVSLSIPVMPYLGLVASVNSQIIQSAQQKAEST